MDSSRPDAELVRSASAGEQSAFAELYERYFDRVYDFVARTVRNRDEAADITQDTFIKAMHSIGSLQDGASFRSWLFTIARNTALNRLERTNRLRPLAVDAADGEEFEFDIVDGDRLGQPEEAAEARELAALVWEAAKGLDPKQLSLLDLHLRQGLDSAEIADVMGVTRNNGYVMFNRMKKAVEESLTALLLLRRGRTFCPALDAALTPASADLSPELRRLIDRHCATCAPCASRRSKYAPLSIMGAFAPVVAPAGLKERLLESVLTSPAPAPAGPTPGAEALPLSPPTDESGFYLPDEPADIEPGVPGRTDGREEAGAAAQDRAPTRLQVDRKGGGRRPWVRRGAIAAAAALLFLLAGGVAYTVGRDEGGETTTLAGTVAPSAPTGGAAISATAGGPPASPSPGASAVSAVSPTPPASVPAVQGSPSPGIAPGGGGTTQTPTATGPASPTTPAPTTGPGTPAPPAQPTTPAPPSVTPTVSPTPTPVTPTVTRAPTSPSPAPTTAVPTTPPPPPPPPCTPSPTFGGPTTVNLGIVSAPTASFTVTVDDANNCTPLMTFSASDNRSWLSESPSSGTVPAGGRTITVTVTQSQLSPGANTGTVTIQAGGSTRTITVNATKL